jgi:hypothetical protein
VTTETRGPVTYYRAEARPPGAPVRRCTHRHKTEEAARTCAIQLARCRPEPVEIRKVGSLPSCQAWYAFPADRKVPGYGPISGSRSRTRGECRAWAERNGYVWSAKKVLDT